MSNLLDCTDVVNDSDSANSSFVGDVLNCTLVVETPQSGSPSTSRGKNRKQLMDDLTDLRKKVQHYKNKTRQLTDKITKLKAAHKSKMASLRESHEMQIASLKRGSCDALLSSPSLSVPLLPASLPAPLPPSQPVAPIPDVGTPNLLEQAAVSAAVSAVAVDVAVSPLPTILTPARPALQGLSGTAGRSVRERNLISGTYTVIGDSLVRGADKYLNKSTTKVNCFPGLKLVELSRILARAEPDDGVRLVVLHVGSNDLKSSNNDYIIGDMFEVINNAKACFPNAKITLSGVLRRRDVPYRRVAALNHDLEWLCGRKNLGFFNANSFINQYATDGIHLSFDGTKVFSNLLKNLLSTMIPFVT